MDGIVRLSKYFGDFACLADHSLMLQFIIFYHGV